MGIILQWTIGEKITAIYEKTGRRTEGLHMDICKQWRNYCRTSIRLLSSTN